jgi:hypothetical protein
MVVSRDVLVASESLLSENCCLIGCLVCHLIVCRRDRARRHYKNTTAADAYV